MFVVVEWRKHIEKHDSAPDRQRVYKSIHGTKVGHLEDEIKKESGSGASENNAAEESGLVLART